MQTKSCVLTIESMVHYYTTKGDTWQVTTEKVAKGHHENEGVWGYVARGYLEYP